MQAHAHSAIKKPHTKTRLIPAVARHCDGERATTRRAAILHLKIGGVVIYSRYSFFITAKQYNL